MARILSENNSRKYKGTTYLEAEDPLVQIIHVKDGVQLMGLFHIVFTSEEISIECTFWREITKVISRKYQMKIILNIQI